MQSTSWTALENSNLSRNERIVISAIEDAGSAGATSEEIREFAARVHGQKNYSSITARFSELEKKGVITRPGVTRKNSNDNPELVCFMAKPPLL